LKLGLGTAQFGLPYGVANQQGKVCVDEISKILEYASSKGMKIVDTAILYGDCEYKLGNSGLKDWNVITKLPEIPNGCIDVISWVENSIYESINRLKIPKLYGLLIHNSEQLVNESGDILYSTLQNLKMNGYIEKVGISIYSPTELEFLYSNYFFDLVQAPFNVFDRRIETSGWLSRLKSAEVEVHVRSVFLQGLLLMSKKNRPIKFNQWDFHWEKWESWLRKNSLTALEASLSFVLSNENIDHVIVGVDSFEHIKEILNASDIKATNPPKSLAINDSKLLNPLNWVE